MTHTGAPRSWPVAISPEDVVVVARTWIGVPWHHQGRSRAGIDCAGYCQQMSVDLEQTDFDSADYGRYPTNDHMRAVLREHAIERTGEPLVGMVALMSFGALPRHMGVLVPYRHGGLALVHALASVGKVVEHRLSPEWRSRIVGLFDFPGVVR